MSEMKRTTRRQMMRNAAVAAGALSAYGAALEAMGFGPLGAGEQMVPFLDEQPANPRRRMHRWHEIDSWITPIEDLYVVSHYNTPEDTDAASWTLRIEGLVERPRTLTMNEIRARPRVEHTVTIECGGNGVSPAFSSAIGNLRWAGTPLAPVLKECGVKPEGIEIVFFGADQGKEKIRNQEFEQNFARSLSLEDAMDDRVFLCYEMNGQPLTPTHGAPLRLVVPGWYGVAWVKWLNRIEVHDRRFAGRFMARDYVTIRGEQRGDEVVWRETLVGPMNIKSMIARVVRKADGNLRIDGAAWNDGTPLKAVEVKIDDGPWQAASIDREHESKYTWKFFRFDWKNAAPGEHRLVSRAIDINGQVQPTADDPRIALKKTYWEANQQVVRRVML